MSGKFKRICKYVTDSFKVQANILAKGLRVYMRNHTQAHRFWGLDSNPGLQSTEQKR
jgi:hypothetical protein